MERLHELYQDYYKAIGEASKSANAFSALLGQPLGNAPCNAQFLKDAKKLLNQYAAEGDPEQTARVLDFVYREPRRYEKGGIPAAYWNIIGVHMLTLELVPLLRPADAAALAEQFEKDYRRRDRLPVQNTLLDKLKSRARE